MNPFQYELSHLQALEAESIHIFREVAAEFERPVLLFSGGKDSIVLMRLAEKAFRPGRFPFPVMHVDTGHNFPEVIEFRDKLVKQLGERMIIASVQESIESCTDATMSRAPKRSTASSRKVITSGKLCPVSTCITGNGSFAGQNAFAATCAITTLSLPPEKSRTGRSNSAATSRRR